MQLVNTIIQDNNGVAVMIDATHNCVQCRGVKHGGASMKTSKLTGAFKDDPATRNEYYEQRKSKVVKSDADDIKSQIDLHDALGTEVPLDADNGDESDESALDSHDMQIMMELLDEQMDHDEVYANI